MIGFEQDGNKKYHQDDALKNQIDWENVMKMQRNAGGHDDQMCGLIKNAEVIGHWNEGDWQGTVATCVMLPNDKFAIYNDYYGSCSGCDSWEGADDEEVITMCKSLADSAYIFNSLKDVIDFLENVTPEDNFDWGYGQTSEGLLEEIRRYMHDKN